MTLTNRELFYRDPTESKIPNDGVAQVSRPETPEQWRVLEWELRSFVCEGAYELGLEKVLTSFTTNLNQDQQPAVWLSGFYGSGKSHFLRVLEHLWRDTELPGGETARNLVDLTDGISDQLLELTNAGKRKGGLWSAAGTLASGKSDAVRLAFLSVLFESAGLPEQYPHARFMMWARENDYIDPLNAATEAEGRTLDQEVHHLYVSPIIAKALLEADPSLGDSVADVRDLLTTQYPPTTKDITDDEMFEAMEEVLRLQSSVEGKRPLTLVVLDEMQQYIGEDGEKALAVQHIAEGCSARFSSEILIVAAGQSALTATATLQKLTDRFTVPVQLSDQDVETVVRQVVLRKKPEHVEEISAALEAASGEIDQELAGTQLAAKAADKPDLVPDYPLLPSRRRFWEHALRAIDRAGKAGVLRTQLRTVHEAARAVAHDPLGHVVGGDFVYDQQSTGMLQSNVLLKEIDELIRGLRSQGPNGELKSRVCALVFLINQIPKTGIEGETGLRATSAYIADLLVEDLATDGSRVRKAVPTLLDELVNDGRLLRINDEYQLQTAVGSEWEQDYRGRAADLRDDPGRIAQVRDELLREKILSELGGLKFTHGTSKTPRRIDVSMGQEEPVASDGDVPVWVRDEWEVTEATAKKAAAEAGDESPVVFVLLPKKESDQIKELLASSTAAQETVDQNPVPQTEDGKKAQLAMKTRAELERSRLDTLLFSVVADARVFQGGGSELTTSASLGDTVRTAVERALVRLFPKFSAADNPNWSKVVTKAREGAPDALSAVGHEGEPTTNGVCKEVLDSITAGGTKGADLHKQFSSSPYGWPKDAINGAVLALMAAGNIRATSEDGSPIHGPKELLPQQIGKARLYKEDDPPSVPQQLAVRGLLAAAKIDYAAGQEGEKIPVLLQHMKELASRAGGEAPLPAPPSVEHIDALLALGGNQLIKSVADDEVRLNNELTTWKASEEKRQHREAEFSVLNRLLTHATDLPVAAELEPAVQAIQDGRQLLDDPDPIKPQLDKLTDSLRAAVTEQVDALTSAREVARDELNAWEDWSALEPEQRAAIEAESELAPPAAPDTSTDTRLLEALDAVSLGRWRDQVGLVPARRDQGKQRAAKLLEPESVSIDPPSATLKTPEELDAYLAELRKQVLAHIDQAKTVII